MINLSRVASSPAFAQAFTINRSTGTFQQGGFVSTPTPISFWGSIQVASDESLQQVPEGDRVTGMLLVISEQEMYQTNPNGLSDTLTWRGQTYKVVYVRPDLDYGYFKAFVSRQGGV